MSEDMLFVLFQQHFIKKSISGKCNLAVETLLVNLIDLSWWPFVSAEIYNFVKSNTPSWVLFTFFKACVIFYQIFIFSPNDRPSTMKLWKMFFISSKKLFSFSSYSNFCIFSLPFHTFQNQKYKWKWNNLWCHNLACINLQM